MDRPGRSCPLAYRYQPEALARPLQLEADTLYVVGGLYGNPAALAAVLERASCEPGGPATIVFNGDFHWLDIDPEDFCAIGEAVSAHHAIKGNVEAELTSEGSEMRGVAARIPSMSATRSWIAPTRSWFGCGRPHRGFLTWWAAWVSCHGISRPGLPGSGLG